MGQAPLQDKRITVVVPVYADWASLSACIESLQEHLDPRHSVLLINDCGPDVELLETNIEHAIAGWSNFSYQRNSENLGFVRTCNRAVFELDRTGNDILLLNSDTVVTSGFAEEMLAVLYASEKHGSVCPRSNNATIASVPFRFSGNGQVDRAPEYALQVYERVRDDLPWYTVVPVTPGFCFLVKRRVIDNFGLFDEVYGAGYNEENDFCLRINRYGFSSVMANHAMVLHMESKSFSSQRKARLQKRNEKILLERFPYYLHHVENYIEARIDPVDWFADIIARPQSALKVLINLHHLPTIYNGTSRNAVSLLAHLKENRDEYQGVQFVVAAEPDAARFHDLASYGFEVTKLRDVDELFHVGYCPSQIFHRESLSVMNRYCLKIAYSHLDIISLRCNEMLARDYAVRSVIEDSLAMADKVVAISDFSLKDMVDYFGDTVGEISGKTVVLHQGFQSDPVFGGSEISDLQGQVAEVVKDGKYVLLIGNDFSHKMIREIVPYLEGLGERFLILGPASLSCGDQQNIHVLPTGGFSDQAVDELISNSKLVLFPSVYEGFGLPIAEAARHGKPLVLADTEVAREIGELYESAVSIGYFGTLDEVPLVIEAALASDGCAEGSGLRTMDDYNRDVIKLLIETAREDVDISHLRWRWRYLARISEYPAFGMKTEVQRLLVTRVKSRNPALFYRLRRIYKVIRSRRAVTT
ncbi:glycosyltransferase [Rhodococcus sp. NPDC003383]